MGSSCVYKNSRAWRRDGYKTIFISGNVYLVQLSEDKVWARPVASGAWMDVTDLDRWNFLGAVRDQRPDVKTRIEQSLEHCYCDQSARGLCDFCAGIRVPKGMAA